MMESEAAGRRGGGPPEQDAGTPASKRARDVTLIVAMLAVITILHLGTGQGQMALHGVFRRFYYMPILYAAFVFGSRGGLLTAVASILLFIPHVEVSLGGVLGAGYENAIETFMYLIAGGLFGWLRDLEERKTIDLRQVSRKLEEAYRKLEERAIQLINIQDYTQSILRSITSGVVTVGPDGSVTTANPAAEHILRVNEAEMIAKRLPALFRDDGGLGQDLSKVLDGRLPRSARDVTLLTKDGKVVHAQASVARMRDIDGRTLGAVVAIEDVSEVKALTAQLIRADRLAAMGELTAGVAHEVRNPLGIIRASVQLLEDSECKTERIREASTIIKQEIDRLDKVVKALLDFGRPSSPTLMPTDVADVLSDIVLFTRKFASGSNVEIIVEVDEDVPRVMADPDQLKQVFLNLVANAVQSMEQFGGTLTLGAEESEGFVEVTVADTGPGIAREDVGKVFDPFYSTKDDGTGLGLTIVHRIVDEHDGHIEVESEQGKGTTFRVSLPALSADA